MLKKIRRSLLIFAIVVLALVSGYIYVFQRNYFNPAMDIGVSFDPSYARYLRLDVGKTFATILDTWKFHYIRLSAHWDEVEPKAGQFNFSELDWLFAEAQKRNALVTLALGQKTPRWPECHFPDWAKTLSPADFKTARLAYISAVVDHFKKQPSLEIWQVENEPFLPFGDCPGFSTSDLTEELNLVSQHDSTHPRLVTDSGELSTWRRTANVAEYFGTTMYRVVWNKYLGYINYDWLPAAFYRIKLWILGRSPVTAFVVELQAEPWIPDQQPKEMSESEEAKSMDLARLKKNIAYAYRVGLPRVYLWGAEWWQEQAASGHPDIANYIQNLPKGH